MNNLLDLSRSKGLSKDFEIANLSSLRNRQLSKQIQN